MTVSIIVEFDLRRLLKFGISFGQYSFVEFLIKSFDSQITYLDLRQLGHVRSSKLSLGSVISIYYFN